MVAKNTMKNTKKQRKMQSKEKVIKKKSKTPVADHVILHQPSLLLSTTYFLNNQCNRHVILGHIPDNDCRPLYILGTTTSFVTLSTSDWLMLMMSKVEIESWFSKKEGVSNDDIIISKNVKVSSYEGSGSKKLIFIENLNCCRVNKSILLNEEEFDKLVQLDSFLFFISKQMQQNCVYVDDYYNLYIYYCLLKEKNYLNDQDFFPPNDLNNCVDIFRLFKEIPIVCKEQLAIDLCKSKTGSSK